jgi:hypothetical protein
MDITNLAPWIIEIVKEQDKIDRGTVSFSLMKNVGEVIGLRVTRNRVISFSKGDNKEVMVCIADLINKLAIGETREMKLTIDARDGRVRKLVISDEVQKQIGG